MLPTYRGADEESGRGEGPLLAARRARANGGASQPAVGLILLTAACCGMLLFQVRPCDGCRVDGGRVGPSKPCEGGSALLLLLLRLLLSLQALR